MTDGGERLPRWRYLEGLLRQGRVRVERRLAVGRGVRCRLIAVCCPAEVEARRRQKPYEKCARRGELRKEAALSPCGWTAFLADVPEGCWPGGRSGWSTACAGRWNCCSSVGSRWAAWAPAGGRKRRDVWRRYAKPPGALRQWLTMTAGQGWRLGCSLYEVESVIQGWGMALLVAAGQFDALVRLLAALGEALRNTPGVERRRRKPAAF